MKTLLILLFLTPIFIFSQEKTDTTIVDYPDKEAEFTGGYIAQRNYLSKNLVYPEKSMMKGEQGKVYVEFIVEIDGALTHVKILQGASRRLNKEAKRVVKNMPNWASGESDGEKVRVRCRIPFNFELTD